MGQRSRPIHIVSWSLTKVKRQFSKERIVFFNKWFRNDRISTCKRRGRRRGEEEEEKKKEEEEEKEEKKNLDTLLLSQKSVKMDRSPKCGMPNCKILEDNIGEKNLCDLEFGNEFLDTTLKANP